MVDCNEGTCAKQQPTKCLVALPEQATIAKQRHCQMNDTFYVLCHFARSYNDGSGG
jgi:hypothetical protein